MRQRFLVLSATMAVAVTLASCGPAMTPSLGSGGTPNEIARRSSDKVFSFLGPTKSGESPYAGLIYVKGIFYGTTQQGGAHNDGTVFKFAGNKLTILHSFAGPPHDGQQPMESSCTSTARCTARRETVERLD